MSRQSSLAVLGLRLSVLGSLASLALAAPLADGDVSQAAHTDASRMGLYFDRTPSAEKMVFVVEGDALLSVGTEGIVSLLNQAVGGTGQRNQFFGISVGNATATGTGNLGIGQGELALLTTGIYNTGVGIQALESVTSANQNTAFGYTTLRAVTTGGSNNGFGAGAGIAITTGANNVCIANGSGTNITTGNRNIAIGSVSLSEIINGVGNIGIGTWAGRLQGNSSNTLYIGDATEGSPTFPNAINSIFIGSSNVAGPLWLTPNRFAPSTATRAGVNLGEGLAPTVPVDGDLWITTTGFYAHVNGVTHDLLAGGGTIGGSIAANQIAVGSGVDAIGGSADLTWDGSILSVTGSFGVSGSVDLGLVEVSTNTLLDDTHHTIIVDATAGNVTITLPATTSITGRRYEIKKVDATANVVTIQPDAGDTIDGAASYNLTAQYQTRVIAASAASNSWWTI